MKLSIILPIYNVEKYIGKCLESIYNQNMNEDSFEVIAVNDGSPDQSVEIIRKYASIHRNILIIDQENRGVSYARNIGIENSNGNFILFVDPDDWIGNQTLCQISDIISNDSESDIIIFNSIKSDCLSKCYDWIKSIDEGEHFNGLVLFKEINYFRGSVCGVAFNKTFLEKYKLRFPLGIRNSEDTIFFSICQTLAKKVTFYNVDFYYVFNRPGSASKTQNLKNINSYKEAFRVCQDLELQYGLIGENASLMEFARYLLFSNLTHILVRSSSSCKSIFKDYQIETYLPIKIDGIPILKGKILILNTSYRFFFYLTKFKYKLKCLFSKHS